jgi:hypothetical protein
MQRQGQATVLKPRQSQHSDQPVEGQCAEDDNACRWEWKFSLDADRHPELSCRCTTCGATYYLSSWQWTLDSAWHTKCQPPSGKHLARGPTSRA